jgi:endopeptidase La
MNLHKAALNLEQELERIRSLNTDDIDLRKQVILSKTMPDNIKNIVQKTLDNMESGSNEYGKQLMFVEDLIKFPWIGEDENGYFEEINKSESKTREALDSIEENLNKSVYGHKESKQHIKELMGKWFKNPKAKGSVLGLCGPPGVGKTLIANSLGKALGIPLVKIPLGGQNDGEIIHGHGFTYSNARPGLIVKKMIEAGSPRCILFFDELDKTCEKHGKNEIYSSLLHVLDGNMNNNFMDKFFQNIKFPLSQVLFVFSYNDADLIDSILLDRVTQINIDPYALTDKVNISRDYLIHEITASFGFERDSVKFDDKDYAYLIDQYTNEAGVRGLSKKIEKIFLKLNMDRIYKRSTCKDTEITKDDPVIITKEIIHKYLEKPKMKIKKVHDKPLVGVINGLYATTSGRGGIIPIQIYNDHSGFSTEFSLRMTGSQGKVMRESVAYAYNTAVAHIRADLLDKYHKNHPRGLHIHTPSGATPKDGPSAGCAFATAFISRILNKKIKNDVAMTGEIDLSGNVTAIGGLTHKLRGAKRLVQK